MAYSINATSDLDIGQYLISFIGTMTNIDNSVITANQVWILNVVGTFTIPPNTEPPKFSSTL